MEIPLLIEKGLLSLSTVSKFGNGVTTNCNTQNQSYSSNDNLSIKYGPDVIRTREPRHVKASNNDDFWIGFNDYLLKSVSKIPLNIVCLMQRNIVMYFLKRILQICYICRMTKECM